jgi:hypothetical protein
MDWGTLASDIIRYQKGSDPDSASEFDYRRYLKFVGQGVFDFVWNYRPWEFRWATTTVTCTAGAADLPADFVSFGKGGGVFMGVGMPPVAWKHLRDVSYWRAAIAQIGQPQWYSVGKSTPAIGGDTPVGPSRQLLLYPMDSRTLTLVYERKPPVLLDSGLAEDVDALATDGSGLEEIPDTWHHIVVYEGVLYQILKKEANSQSVTEQMALYKAGLERMSENERQGREAPHYLVPFASRRFR